MRWVALLAGSLAGPVSAQEFEIGRDEIVTFGELASRGHEPFPTSGAVGDLFGMRGSAEDNFLCFSVDKEDEAATRLQAIEALLGGEGTSEVPNIPILCVRMQ